jgi:hypothetical protein
MFKNVCEEGNVLYGAIWFERVLLVPAQLTQAQEPIRPELFISRESNRIRPPLVSDLQTPFGDSVLEEWSSGWFFSGFAPFNGERRTVAVSHRMAQDAAGCMGQALRLLHDPKG